MKKTRKLSVSVYFWPPTSAALPSFVVMWKWTSSTSPKWRNRPTWWVSSGGVWSQVRAQRLRNAAFLQPDLFVSLCSASVGVCRQVRDLREPPGQLGSRCYRPQQRDVGHAGAEPSARQEGQRGWGSGWVKTSMFAWFSHWTLFSLRSALWTGRKVEASEVHHLWKLGGRGVWPHRLCRIRRGRRITDVLVVFLAAATFQHFIPTCPRDLLFCSNTSPSSADEPWLTSTWTSPSLVSSWPDPPLVPVFSEHRYPTVVREASGF